MSLSPKLLAEFDKSMVKAGFTDRSKAIQTALHSFVDEHKWKDNLLVVYVPETYTTSIEIYSIANNDVKLLF